MIRRTRSGDVITTRHVHSTKRLMLIRNAQRR
jgi:hypothetical protein